MTSEIQDPIAAVRRFNRFYTQLIGVLHEGLLKSEFSLTEMRVLYELAHRDKPTASEIGEELALDLGYLSRILAKFKKRGLVASKLSEADGRQNLLNLTKQGERTFATLDDRARDEVAGMLSALAESDRRRLIKAMHSIESVFGGKREDNGGYVLRTHQPGDMGQIVSLQGILYAEEYGWDEQYEALAASITAKFIQHYDPKRERCWVAEKDGEVVGSVFLVKQSKTVAKLRLLFVDPKARGLGIGARLVAECVRFARQAGYKKITLWTQSILEGARHIYDKTGFRLVRTEAHHSFGHDLTAEIWEMDL